MPINFNLRKYQNKIFIETGTWIGQGIMKALDNGFQTIYSIDIDEKMNKSAKEKFKNDSRVHLILGDSQHTLKTLLNKINEPVTFWLDAHLQPEQIDTVSHEKQSPLMEELDIILSHHIKTHVIMIDDVRIIKAGNPWKENISISSILEFVKSKNPNFTLVYEDGVIPNDIMVLKFLNNGTSAK